jgi:hypothetical protein
MGEQVEERMMAEWAARLAPGSWRTHVRVGRPRAPPIGRILTKQEEALLRITLPEVDLVRTLPGGGVELVEFIIWRPHETIGQLLYYAGLIPSTPGLEDLPADKISLRIVTGLEDPAFKAWVESLGIAFEVYRPGWLEEALASRRGGK